MPIPNQDSHHLTIAAQETISRSSNSSPIPVPSSSPSIPNRKRAAFDVVSPPQHFAAPFVPSSPSPSGDSSFVPNHDRISSMPGVTTDPHLSAAMDDSTTDDEILATSSVNVLKKSTPSNSCELSSASRKRLEHQKRLAEYNNGQCPIESQPSEPLLLTDGPPSPPKVTSSLSSSFSMPVVSNTSSTYANPILSKRVQASTPGTTGLSNLGNTCFMNSALQCLSNTASLTQYFLQDQWKDELNVDNPLGMKGAVPKAYADLIHHLWNGSESRSTVFSPRNFKYVIGQLNSTFQGYGQQDSHELLSSLLDGLHEDLNRIKKKEYIEDPDMGDMTEAEFARVSWEAYRKRNDSIIVDLFQGQLRNRTECQVCGRVSIKFDPYMYLQVPLPDSQKITMKVRFMPLENASLSSDQLRPRQVYLNMNSGDSVPAFKSAFSKSFALPSMTQSVFAEVFQNKIYKVCTEERMSDFSTNDVMYLYDTSQFDSLFQPHLSGATSAPDVVPLAMSCTFDSVDGSGSYSSYSRPSYFGVPLYLPTPSYLAWKTPMPVSQTASAVGLTLYTLAVRNLRRFSRVPLFRKKGSDVTMDQIREVLNADLTDEAKQQLLDKYEGVVGPRDLDESWEPIPGLFKLYLVHTEGSGHMKRFTEKELLYPSPTSNTEELSTPVAHDTPVPPATELESVETQSPSVKVNDVEPLSPKSESGDLAQRLDRFASFSEIPTNSDPSSEILQSNATPAITVEPEQAESQPEDTVSHFEIKPSMEIWLEWDRKVAEMVFGAGSFGSSYGSEEKGAFSAIDDEESKLRAEAEVKGEKGDALSVEKCLKEYSKEEILDGDDTMYCSRCKAHQPTKKKLEVYSAPDILVIHLKRFSNTGRISRRKIDSVVAAPLEGLNMRSILVGAHEGVPDDDVLYDLYAVSNHFGGLGGGHYTAYVKNPLDHQWYNCDDSSVSPATGRQIVTQAAYLLFYKRRSVPDLDLKEAVQKSTDNFAKSSSMTSVLSDAVQPFRIGGPANRAGEAAVARAIARKQSSPTTSDELVADAASTDATAENSPTPRSVGSPSTSQYVPVGMVDDEIPRLGVSGGPEWWSNSNDAPGWSMDDPVSTVQGPSKQSMDSPGAHEYVHVSLNEVMPEEESTEDIDMNDSDLRFPPAPHPGLSNGIRLPEDETVPWETIENNFEKIDVPWP